MEDLINSITLADCMDIMKDMPDDSIDLTLTSPPYDNLRTYNDSLEWSIDVWKKIIKELFRITKPGGVVVWIVGDATIDGSESGTSFKQALYFKEVGFNLHDTMIWNKMSQACHDFRNKRYKQEFEYMFVMSKNKPISYNEICDRYVKNAGKIVKKSTKRKTDGTIRKFKEIKLKQKQARSNIWNIEVERKSGHPAPFPEKLAIDHIITWSNEGDIVLDPFSGSGTTAMVCHKLKRNFIAIEKDKDYHRDSVNRLDELRSQGVLF